MKIVVLVKQVPDSTEITVDKVTGTLVRDGVPSIINPDDLAGLEAALELKDKDPSINVTVVSMGPPQAKGMLQETIARGADEAYLLTDRRLGGADTCATSRTLAAALKKIGYDLIIAPEKVTVKKALEDEEQILTAKMPCVLTTLSGMNKPRYMNCNDIVDSFNNPVKIMTFDDLDLDQSVVGLAGSPTKVHATFTKDVSAETQTYNMPAKETAELIAKTLKEKQLITK